VSFLFWGKYAGEWRVRIESGNPLREIFRAKELTFLRSNNELPKVIHKLLAYFTTLIEPHSIKITHLTN